MLGDRLVHFRYLYDDEVSFETNEELHVGMSWSRKLQKGYGSAWRHVVCENDGPEAREDRKFTTSRGQVYSLQSHRTCESDLHYDTPEPDTIYMESYYLGHETMRLSVLRSCRQIYVEANNMLWTSNTFSFADSTTFKRFMMTRTINQRRLIKSLRLQTDSPFNEACQWEKSLNLALVRSLSALRRLRLNLEYTSPFTSYDSAGSSNLPYITANFHGLQKLSILPLTEVEIVVGCTKYESDDQSTRVDRKDLAEEFRKILLNPEGAQIYAEDQLKRKEQCRRAREDAAKIRVPFSRPRLRAESEGMANQPLTRPSE